MANEEIRADIRNYLESSFPVARLSGRDRLLLLFDKTGAVIKFWDDGNSSIAGLIPMLKARGGNLHDIFEFGDLTSGIEAEGRLFQSKKDIHISRFFPGFITNLPVLVLSVYP